MESTEDYELTAAEIIEFCAKWDPLPFHVDEEAAAATPVGKLFTSAVHSMAIAIRLGHQMQTEPSATVMGLGIVRSELNLTNQRGETVIRFKAAALIRQRPQES